MPKVKAVKWAIGADEPEELDEFLSNDEILDKHTNKKTQEVSWPGKGPFTFLVRQMRVKPNRNGDDRLSVMLVLKEPKDSDAASWNQYLIWDGFNVTEQGKPYINRFLRALGLSWKDFMTKSKVDDQDPPHVVQIGGLKFEDVKDVTLRATVKVKPPDDFNDDDHLEIARYLPVKDEEPEDSEDEGVEDEDEETFAEAESEEDDADEEEDEEQEGLDELQAELEGMKPKALRKRAVANGASEDEVDGVDKETLIALIIDQEWSEEDEDDEGEDEDEDEDDPEEELREELKGMSKAALEKRAQRTAKKFKGDPSSIPTTKPKLIDWIVNAELGEPPF